MRTGWASALKNAALNAWQLRPLRVLDRHRSLAPVGPGCAAMRRGSADIYQNITISIMAYELGRRSVRWPA